MKKYLRIYKKIFIFNLMLFTSYRVNFINSVVSSMGWGIFSLASIILLTSKTPVVFGWKREEMLLLTGCYAIVSGLFHFLFSRNFDRFSRIINNGELDMILVKPLDCQFLLSIWLVNYASLSRILMGILFVFYMTHKIGVAVSLFSIIEFVVFSLFGLSLLYSVWFLVISITLWFSRLSNLTDLMYSVMGLSARPPEMFKEFSLYVFVFLFPLMLTVAIPTKLLLQRSSGQDLIILVTMSCFFLLATRLFWKFALRFYTSAGG